MVPRYTARSGNKSAEGYQLRMLCALPQVKLSPNWRRAFASGLGHQTKGQTLSQGHGTNLSIVVWQQFNHLFWLLSALAPELSKRFPRRIGQQNRVLIAVH